MPMTGGVCSTTAPINYELPTVKRTCIHAAALLQSRVGPEESWCKLGMPNYSTVHLLNEGVFQTSQSRCGRGANRKLWPAYDDSYRFQDQAKALYKPLLGRWGRVATGAWASVTPGYVGQYISLELDRYYYLWFPGWCLHPCQIDHI